jgi:hypothetical protein
MRRLFLLIVLVVLIVPVSGQQSSTFTCDEETDYRTQFSLTLPEIGSATSQVIVSALGVDEFVPVMQISAPEMASCAAGIPYYALSEADSVLFTPESSGVQEIAAIPGTTQIQIGAQDQQPGAFYVVLESGFEAGMTGDHEYEATIPAEIVASATPIDLYLFALTDEGTPQLRITNDTETVNATLREDLVLDSPLGVREGAAFATLIPQADTLSFSVERQENMLYALVVAIRTGTPRIGDGAAQVTSTEGSVSLFCDERLIYDNGVQVTLPDDGRIYQVTLLGVGDVDPMLGLVAEDGTGICYDNQPETLLMRLQLPSVTASGSPLSALGQADAALRTIVAGGQGSAAGSYILLIEGGAITETDAASISVEISPGMVSAYDYLTVYAIAANDELDPALVLVDEAGAAISTVDGSTLFCDNAGQVDSCPPDTISLNGSFVPLAEGGSLPALELDAMLLLPVEPDMQGKPIEIRVSAVEASGAYLLVLHIVTD